ncbi:hypothetical protein BC835DRAFT_1310087 [Cytidiella melzeri]|nr:hypothetical protein BC835DRAFT_1310087 [Cytidiella melzeri]
MHTLSKHWVDMLEVGSAGAQSDNKTVMQDSTVMAKALKMCWRLNDIKKVLRLCNTLYQVQQTRRCDNLVLSSLKIHRFKQISEAASEGPSLKLLRPELVRQAGQVGPEQPAAADQYKRLTDGNPNKTTGTTPSKKQSAKASQAHMLPQDFAQDNNKYEDNKEDEGEDEDSD